MKYDVLLAAVLASLAIYTMQWSFSFGWGGIIHLPKDRQKWLFFDKVNEYHPKLFKSISSFSAFFGVLSFGHSVIIWPVFAILFIVPFSFYFITCIRSFYLRILDPSTYNED